MSNPEDRQRAPLLKIQEIGLDFDQFLPFRGLSLAEDCSSVGGASEFPPGFLVTT
jgi:hypothetical protein